MLKYPCIFILSNVGIVITFLYRWIIAISTCCQADTNINSLWINISWSVIQHHVLINDNSQVRKNYFSNKHVYPTIILKMQLTKGNYKRTWYTVGHYHSKHTEHPGILLTILELPDNMLKINYSWTSVAWTLMARLPRLFRTRSWVPWKKIQQLHIWDNLSSSFYILKMVYCVYSLGLPRWGGSNEKTQHTFMLKKIENISLFCLLTWRYD